MTTFKGIKEKQSQLIINAQGQISCHFFIMYRPADFSWSSFECCFAHMESESIFNDLILHSYSF